MNTEVQITYEASKTVRAFMSSEAPVRLIIGPVGSGKSSGCCMEILRQARRMPKDRRGLRRSRWAVVRNTYPELRDTTIKTFKEWIPPVLGRWSKSEHTFLMRFDDVECEVIFRPLDQPDDVKKLLSLELTGLYFNEMKEIPRAVFDLAQSRVGRYPRRDDVPRYWSGVIGDTNPPDEDHWIFKLFEEEKPEGFEVYHQPSGTAPDAENVEHLERCVDFPKHESPCRCYYPKLMRGKSQAWIDCYVHAKYVYVADGKPVYPEFIDTTHVVEFELPGRPTVINLGQDYGLTPACVWGYEDPRDGQIMISHEFISEHMGALNFGKLVAQDCKTKFPAGTKFRGWGDPSGTTDSSTDERTPIDVVNGAFGPNQTIIAPAPTNEFMLRRDAVGNALTTLTMLGRPGLIIHPRCRKLRKAMGGGYCFQRLQVSGDERFRDVPLKNEFSHVAEALQYLVVGLGRDQRVLDGGRERDAHVRFSVKKSLGHYRPRS